MRGFMSFPQPLQGDKVRGKPEKFADHYTQATLFYRSQSPIEQEHIARALRFELSKVQVPAIRQRVIAMLLNIDQNLAKTVARDLGMDLPDPLPLAIEPLRPEVEISPALSLLARPGDGSIRTRRIAILVADGADLDSAIALYEGLDAEGAVPLYVGSKLGPVQGEDGKAIEVEVTVEIMPSVLFDAIVVPGGDAAANIFENLGQVKEFIVNAYRHCKPILALGAGCRVVEKAGIPAKLPTGETDSGLLLLKDGKAETALATFIKAIAMHRHFARDLDPTPV
jgi:catalase